MEQERVTYIILISTIVVLVFIIAMIVLFSIYREHKNKLILENNSLKKKVDHVLSKLDI